MSRQGYCDHDVPWTEPCDWCERPATHPDDLMPEDFPLDEEEE